MTQNLEADLYTSLLVSWSLFEAVEVLDAVATS